MLHVEAVETMEGFRALEPEWNHLLSAGGRYTIFSTFEWQWTWWDVFGKDKRLLILLARDGERLVAIAPFLIARAPLFEAPVHRVEFIGASDGEDLTDYNDLIIAERPGEAIAAFAAFLQRKAALWDVIYLRDFPEFSPNYEPLRHKLASRYLLSQTNALYGVNGTLALHICPYVDATSDWTTYIRGRNGKLRREAERERRRLEEEGPLHIELCRDEASASEVLGLLFEQHKERWARSGHTSRLARPEIQAFYYRIIDLAMARGWLDLSYLALNGRRLAVDLAFRYGSSHLWHLSAYAAEYSHLAAGKALMLDAMERVFNDPTIREFDFMRGAEPYKARWATEKRTNRLIRAYKKSLLGAAFYYWGEIVRPRLAKDRRLRNLRNWLRGKRG